MSSTALNKSVALNLINSSGLNLEQGDVVILNPISAGSVVTTTTANYSDGPIGVVLEPAGIADGNRGLIAFGGYVPRVNLDSSAALFDKIFTDTVAGQGSPSATYAEGAFGIVLKTGALPDAFLFGIVEPPAPPSGDYTEIGGRLTLTTAVPVTTGDVASAATLYYTPYRHNRIGLYYNSAWSSFSTAEISVSLGAISVDTNYDVFAYYTGAAVALELLSWSNDTTRATALARQDGIWTKSGDATRRYIGTIRGSGAGVCEDSDTKRYVWNNENRCIRRLLKKESTASWSYNSTTRRPANGSTANRVEVVVGLEEILIDLNLGSMGICLTASNGWGAGIGEDSTSTIHSDCINTYGAAVTGGVLINSTLASTLRKYVPLGYHYYQWLEYSQSGTTNFTGEDITASYQAKSGLSGHILG